MFFQHRYGIEDDGSKANKQRIAVRGIIVNPKYELLMVHNNLGDYKFPGGGVKEKENNHQALIREIKEETGYQVTLIKELIGEVIERKMDHYDKDQVFEMISHYYLCFVSDYIQPQKLDDYEKALDFQPIWISIDHAYKHNTNLLEQHHSPWIRRETKVLEVLHKKYNDLKLKAHT